MNSNYQVMKWLGLVASLLLLMPFSMAVAQRSDIFNPPEQKSAIDFCQTYNAGPLQLENLAEQVSVRYIGITQTNRNERHGTYSFSANGKALIFLGTSCKKNYYDTTTFEYSENWQSENMNPPGIWWSTNLTKFEVDYLLAGITKFNAKRSHRKWEWRSQYFGRWTHYAGEEWYAQQDPKITQALRKYGFVLRSY